MTGPVLYVSRVADPMKGGQGYGNPEVWVKISVHPFTKDADQGGVYWTGGEPFLDRVPAELVPDLKPGECKPYRLVPVEGEGETLTALRAEVERLRGLVLERDVRISDIVHAVAGYAAKALTRL